MIIKASERLALVLAAGLLLASSVQAATVDDDSAADSISPDDTKVLPNIPPSIANANAQMLFANAQMNAAAAIPAGSDVLPVQASGNQASDNQANASTNTGTFMVAADQLNDADRTLQEGSSTPATSASSPPAPATAITGESTALDQTSLIGKIFIGFGALLTMASAARMFFS
jgi:hypothetical protein